MTTTVGIRDLARNINILQEYDYVHIEDKKSHEYKGVLLSPKYALEFENYLIEKSNREKEEKLKRLKMYGGKGQIDTKFDGLNSSEIKKQIVSEKMSE